MNDLNTEYKREMKEEDEERDKNKVDQNVKASLTRRYKTTYADIS
jgi:hypothetical protein